MAILLTKVRPPQRRKDILHRVRLVDTLHQNLHRKLTFVSAPAGYGKTTLLIDFAADIDAIVCWYLIGPDDNELLQFLRHIVAAFQQQVPDFGHDLEELLNSPGAAPDPSSLAVELINEVQQKITDFCVLILDDYHLAGENEQIADFIESFLEHLPDHLRLLIGSRSVYGIPTANLYIRDELVTISAEELRFRAEELQRLVLQNYHVRLSEEQANELAARSDGWIVAILLAIRSMENGALPKLSGGTEQVYEYLAEEVVNRQAPDLREFMYSTSVVEEFTEEFCNYLLETKDSARFLRAVEERNLFVSRTETREGNSYRYHQLFADFLRDHFSRHEPERMRAIHARAAQWFHDKEQWEPAIRHEFAAGQPKQAATWIDQVADQYYAEGRQALLTRWYEQLKEVGMEQNAPRVLLYCAKVLINQSDFATSENLLEIAESLFNKKNDAVHLANLLVTRSMIYRLKGELPQAEQLADHAETLLSIKDGDPDHLYRWSQAERVKGIARDYAHNTEESIRHLSAAVETLEKLIATANGKSDLLYTQDLAYTYTDLGVVYLNNGDILGAQKAFSTALELHKKNRSNPAPLAIARSNMAYIYHQTGHYKEAWEEYRLAAEQVKTSQWHRVLSVILIGQASLLFDLEEFEESKTLYKTAIGLGQQHNELAGTDGAFLGLSEIERQRENFEEALSKLREGYSLGGQILTKRRYSYHLGLIYYQMGQAKLALEQVNAILEDQATSSPTSEVEVLAHLLKARIEFKKELKDETIESLRMALEGVARLGYDQFFVVAARPALDLLKEASKTLKTAQLKALIKRVADFKTGKIVIEREEEAAPVPDLHLEIRALGTSEVRKDGELLPLSAWRSTRARALFFYIVDRHQARKEDIGLDFWPDFSPGKISSNFHATLWRVRQALGGKDLVVFNDDSYSLHPAISVWYDVAEFENYIQQAADPTLTETERAETLRQALRLYRGDFLHDVFLEWADRRREQLQNSYMDALVALADMEQTGKHFSEARELYLKALDIDPYRDKIHLALMQCLVSAGSPSAAKAHFQDYKATLRRDLNAEPLPELQNFYEKLPV